MSLPSASTKSATKAIAQMSRESAKRVYRAQPIFATWSQERIFVPIGLLDGDELQQERWVVTEPGTHQVATQHGTNHCLHIGDRWLTGHLVRPGAVTPAFEGISHICQEDVRVGLGVETVVWSVEALKC